MEIVLIVVLLFLVFKTKKLPEIVQAFGKGIIEFKKATRDTHDELDAEVNSNHPGKNEAQSDINQQNTNQAKPKDTKEG